MNETLYPDQPAPEQAKAPSLLEQIEGVFTAPRALFDRLNKTPSWVPAFITMMSTSLIVTAVWGSKVDIEGLLRPMMEKNPNATADQIDQGITFMTKFGPVIFTIQGLIAVTFIIFLTALLYWLISLGTSEEEKPGFIKSLTATVVPMLVALPSYLLILLLSLIKGVGALTPEKIPPTSLGYFIHAESPKVSGLFYALDIFMIATWVMIYLAARHTMRLKPIGAALCTASSIAIVLLFRVVFAK